MPFSNGQNDFDLTALVDITIPTITNLLAAGVVQKYVRVPFACTFVRMDLAYVTEAGTTPSLTGNLRRSTTDVVTLTEGTAATMETKTTVETGQNANFDEGEVLNVELASANDDNDFTGVSVQVWVQRRND